MKTTTFLMAVLFGCLLISVQGQTFNTGFDTPAARSAWTEYRLGGTLSTHWSFNTAFSVSPTYSIYHDYPMSGDTVADWFVSPKLVFTGNSGFVSLYSRVYAMSSPPSVYYGVWVSFGSKDPHDGDYTELHDLTLFPAAQNVWTDTTINTVYTGDTGYIAIKYTADNYMWLMVWIDEISVDSALAATSGIDFAEENEAVNIYPNPSRGIINITGKEIRNITVFDLSGQMIFQTSTEQNNFILDLSRQSKGIYFLRIEKSDGVITRKIVLF